MFDQKHSSPKMTWYFNFCAPHIPNDSTINFHRYLQAGCLAGLLFIYSIIHIYYLMFVPGPQQDKQVNSQSNSDGTSEKEKASEENSENNNDDDKSISIAGGEPVDENSSYVTFNTTAKGKKPVPKSKFQIKKQSDLTVFTKVTLEQIQSYFSIVYGHFAIASAFSIMYSPYAEQSIATIVYILLVLILMFFNSRRKTKTTRFVWGCMCFLIMFLTMSALLEVGQSNFNKITKECFSIDYKSLY